MQSAEENTDQPTALGKAIVIRRTELGLSRNDLRDRTGLSYPYVAELEKGTKRMSASSLQTMADALELRPAELLAMADALAGRDDDVPVTTGAADTAAEAVMPAVEPPAGAAVRPAPASRSRAVMPASADAGSRWFRSKTARASVQRVSSAPAPPAPKAVREATVEERSEAGIDDVDAVLALAEQRIRAIVRDELRKAGIEPG